MADDEAVSLTSTEKWLVDVWSRVFRTPISVHDDFFDLGGDSLLAMQIVSAAGGRFDIYALFNHSTVEALSKHLDASG